MKFRMFLCVSLSFPLISCASTKPPDPLAHPTSLNARQIERLKAGVAAGLKDPESARFGETFTASDDGTLIHVCGYVNARNSFGGYVGLMPFYAAGSHVTGDFRLVAVGGEMYRRTDIGSAVVQQLCAEKGLSI